MPNVNVTERKVSPKLDYGLLTGLIAGAAVWVWMLLIGGLGGGSAADYGTYVSGFALGSGVIDSPGFGPEWLMGTGIHFVTWALIGIVWALLWPKIRKYGTFSVALIFAVVMYFLIEQIVGRLINAAVVDAIGFTGLWFGYLFGGLVFAFRYRGK